MSSDVNDILTGTWGSEPTQSYKQLEEEETPFEKYVREMKEMGWEPVTGYPVVLDEEYVIGTFRFFASRMDRAGRVWRKLVKYQ